MKTKFFTVLIATAALALTACDNHPEYSSDKLSLVINGASYEITLPAEQPVDLTTLCTEFDASVEIVNASAFKSITVDGQKLKNGKCSLPVSEISKDKQILIIEWTHGNSDYYEGVDIPVFLYSTPEETLEHRRLRARDKGTDSPFTTMVLEIEQDMLMAQSKKAKIIVSKSGEIIDEC